ncbi:MAG: hypothetical protein OEU26_03025, partial [Candidatus Tectomicrobia bacterium]|nr:hypothetical protein [Candidatus Tectomicrobia bacterium]
IVHNVTSVIIKITTSNPVISRMDSQIMTAFLQIRGKPVANLWQTCGISQRRVIICIKTSAPTGLIA